MTRKLLLFAAVLGTLAALMPLAALAAPGNSVGNRNDDSQYCYSNGHGFTVVKDESATCF